jgi:hypothetical protein
MLFGGYGVLQDPTPTMGESVGYLDDTWLWDGRTWTQNSAVQSPPRREQAAVATLDGSVVLFGGLFTNFGDTWLWNGTGWSDASSDQSPPDRSSAAMATLDGKVLLFGGDILAFAGGTGGAAGPVNDTWEWNGSKWTELSPATSPSPRERAAIAELDGKLVLFGGRYEGASGEWEYLNDTWTWDGSSWTQLAPPTSPPARASGVAGSVGETMVLFGGFGPGVASLGDTWTFDGSTWREVVGPGPDQTESPASMGCF